MYKTFNEYQESREQAALYQKLDEICFLINASQKPFSEVWEQDALPLLLESEDMEEDQLLNELLDKLGKYAGMLGGNAAGGAVNAAGAMANNAWQGAKNFGREAAKGWQNQRGGPQAPAASGGTSRGVEDPASEIIPDDQVQNMGSPEVVPNDQVQDMGGPLDPNNPQHQAMLDKGQKIIEPIRQEFGRAIQGFKDNMQRMATQSSEPNQHHQYAAADILAKNAEGWLKNWNPQMKRAGQNGPSYKKDYQSAYDQNRNNSWNQGMANMQQQQPSSPNMAAARNATSQGIGYMNRR